MKVPFLMEGDLVSLSPEFILKKTYLADTTLGAKHTINAKSYRAIVLLKILRKYSEWALKAGLDKDEELELMTFLNHAGALRIKRTWWKTLRFSLLRAAWFANGARITTITHRRPGNLTSVINATLRATWFIWASWPILIYLVYGSGAFDTGKFTLLSGMTLVYLILSLIAHEYTHVYMAEIGGKPSSVIQQGVRLGILHPPLSRSQEICSALFAPMVGALAAVALGMGSVVFAGEIALRYAAFVALLHGASWLPWYGDGITLWKHWGAKWA